MSNLAKNNPWAVAVPDEPQAMPSRPKNYLERIALLYGTSGLVTEGKGIPGQYGFGKNVVLPKEFTALIVKRRPHAIFMEGGKPSIESFDLTEPEFQEIAELEMDPTVKNDNTRQAKVGVDYLIWVAEIGEAGYLHLAGSALENSKQFADAMPTAERGPLTVVVSSEQRKNSRHTWIIPKAEAANLDIVMPTPEQIARMVDLFDNQKPQGREEAPKRATRKAKK